MSGDDQSHSHAPEHARAHGHPHAHGAGRQGGWLQALVPHSHRTEDSVDAALESNARGIRAVRISLVGLGVTAVFQLVIVLLSGSVGLLADTIHNFADAGTSIPLWIAFALAGRRPSRRFPYGYARTEDVAGAAIVLIIFSSACVAAWESVRKLLHPEAVTHLGWAAVAAVVGFLGNETVAVFRIRVGREIGSAALVADGQHARIDGLTSLAVLVGVAGVAFGVPILDPLVGIAITVAILFIVKGAAAAMWLRMIDGIEPELLDEIEHAARHAPGVLAVRPALARWVGHRVHCEVEVGVEPSLAVDRAEQIAGGVERSVRAHLPRVDRATVRVYPVTMPE